MGHTQALMIEGRNKRITEQTKRLIAQDATIARQAEQIKRMREALRESMTFDGAVAERSHTLALKRLAAINELVRAALHETEST